MKPFITAASFAGGKSAGKILRFWILSGHFHCSCALTGEGEAAAKRTQRSGRAASGEKAESVSETTGTPRVMSGKLAALRRPLAFDPGERWEYGVNIDWVGRIVEAVGGQPLDAYLRDRVFVATDDFGRLGQALAFQKPQRHHLPLA